MCGFMAMKNLFPSKESHWQISVQVTKSASKIRLSFVYVHAPSGSDLRIKIMATSWITIRGTCFKVFKILLLICFYYGCGPQKILIILFCFMILLGDFERYFVAASSRFLEFDRKCALKLFYSSKCRTRYLDSDSSMQQSKQQLDLHRFNKLAIYRLMFLALDHMHFSFWLTSSRAKPRNI